LLKKNNLSYENKIAIIEKGMEFGSHAISGGILDPLVLKQLFPNFQDLNFPIEAVIQQQSLYYLTETLAFKLPIIPSTLNSKDQFIISLSKVVEWMAKQAEQNDIVLLKQVVGTEILSDGDKVIGVQTDALTKYQLHAKVTVLGEGSAGVLTKDAITKFQLAQNSDPAIFELGVKEIYELKDGSFEAGRVINCMGFPLTDGRTGGAFLYGMDKNKLAIGLISHLGSSDPHLDVHADLQRLKTHPFIRKILDGATLMSYGAKTLPCGGYYTIPQIAHDGLLILGDGANLVDSQKLKGLHTAMQSGIFAAEVLLEGFMQKDFSMKILKKYPERLEQSWVYRDLKKSRNFTPALEKGIPFPGGPLLAFQMVFNGLNPTGKLTTTPDFSKTKEVDKFYACRKKRAAPVVDDKIVVDKLSDVFLSKAVHDEHQPSHITIKDSEKCRECMRLFEAPCTKFCPAQVYELNEQEIIINFSNCVHCKSCDSKCPMENIVWRLPLAGGGPQYSIM
jgi:electron-transferring-flavoprotein dehydrogenase